MKQIAHEGDHPLLMKVADDGSLNILVFDEHIWEEHGDCVEQFEVPLHGLLVSEAVEDDDGDQPKRALLFIAELEQAIADIRSKMMEMEQEWEADISPGEIPGHLRGEIPGT